MGAFLLGALKVIGFLLLGLVLLFLLALACPLWVNLRYEEEKVNLSVKVFGIRFQIFPEKPRKEKKRKAKKPKKPAKKAAPAKANAAPAQNAAAVKSEVLPQPEAQEALQLKSETATKEAKPETAAAQVLPTEEKAATAQNPEKTAKSEKSKDETAALTLEKALDMLGFATGAVKKILKRVRVYDLELLLPQRVLPLKADNAMQSALLYGTVNAAVSSATMLLDDFVRLRVSYTQVVPYFGPGGGGEEEGLIFACRVGASPLTLIICALSLLPEFKKIGGFELVKQLLAIER